jgi:hypothetical protein
MEIHVDDTQLWTEGLDEVGHPELFVQIGSREYLSAGYGILQRLGEVVLARARHFKHGERLSFQVVLIELREYQHQDKTMFAMWEPFNSGWHFGLRRGMKLLHETEELEREYQSAAPDDIELNLVCSMSPRLAESEKITMRRRAGFANHSGWEIIACEDEGNPACLSHPALSQLWRRNADLLPFLCLPTGSEIVWKKDVPPDIGKIKDPERAVWEEPDQVWAHHDAAWSDKADWMVSGRLPAGGEDIPGWEWVPIKRVGEVGGVVCATPFLLHGLALGDEVLLNSHGVIKARNKRGSRHAIRVEFGNKDVEARIMKELKDQQLECEWMNDAVLAIDLPDRRLARKVFHRLHAEDQADCWILSHTLPRHPQPLNLSLARRAGQGALLVAIFLGMVIGLLMEAERAPRLYITGILSLSFALLLFAFLLSRWWVARWETDRSWLHGMRMMGSGLVFCGLVLFLLQQFVFEAEIPGGGWIAFALSLLAALGIWKRDQQATLPVHPNDNDIPPPFYRYARARIEPVEDKVEFHPFKRHPHRHNWSKKNKLHAQPVWLATEPSQVQEIDPGEEEILCPQLPTDKLEVIVAGDGKAEVYIYLQGAIETRSYDSLHQAVFELSAKYDIGTGSWWYGR